LDAAFGEARIPLPQGVGEQVSRAAFEYMRTNPIKSGSFYDISSSDLLALVRKVEKELPGGHTNPDFASLLGQRLRDFLSQAHP
jgi:hypothetical protein